MINNSKIGKFLFFQFFSFTCSSCKSSTIDKDDSFCIDCHSKINFISEPYCNSCGANLDTIFSVCSKCIKEDKPPWQRAISIMQMKGFSRDLVIKYKYYNDTSLIRPFSKFCSEKLEYADISPDIITYIPLHWMKYFKRGYNQSSLLTKFISKEVKIPFAPLLKRIKHTKSQTKLSTKQRRKNILGAFTPINIKLLQDKKILLVDDVYTTGSTIRTATKILLTAGAKEVYILILARR